MQIVIIRSARSSGKSLTVSEEFEEYLKDNDCILQTLEEYEAVCLKGMIKKMDEAYEGYVKYSEHEVEKTYSRKIDFQQPKVQHQVKNRKPRHLVKKIIR